MKNLFIMLLCFCGFTGVNNLFADDLPSCDDLVEIANIFDDVAAELQKLGQIQEDSELDKALGECVSALDDLSNVESNVGLSNSVKKLAEAWEKMDWETFKLSLDSVIANLDRIRRADCS